MNSHLPVVFILSTSRVKTRGQKSGLKLETEGWSSQGTRSWLWGLLEAMGREAENSVESLTLSTDSEQDYKLEGKENKTCCLRSNHLNSPSPTSGHPHFLRSQNYTTDRKDKWEPLTGFSSTCHLCYTVLLYIIQASKWIQEMGFSLQRTGHKRHETITFPQFSKYYSTPVKKTAL